MDEKIQRRCRRYVVEQTLTATASSLTTEQLKPLYDPEGGFLSGLVGSAIRIPVKLALFPFRKAVKIVTSIRGVPREILHVYLLGHILLRQLRMDPQRVLPADELQRAFEKAFRQIDLRIARAAIADVLKSVSDWKSSAKKEARHIYDQPDTASAVDELGALKQDAQRVRQALDRPEVVKVLNQFEQRFDRLLGQ